MMKKDLNIVNINGLKCVYQTRFSILELVNYMGFNTNVIVIDYNGYILESSSWKTTFLQHDDSVEILSMAGGG